MDPTVLAFLAQIDKGIKEFDKGKLKKYKLKEFDSGQLLFKN